MSTRILMGLGMAALLGVAGCAYRTGNRVFGDNVKRSTTWYGELGITGHLNEVIVEPGSKLTKLSIIGEGNTVQVADGVPLGKIEVWGGNNTIYIPENLDIRSDLVGKGNRIIPRPLGSFAKKTTEYRETGGEELAPVEEATTETAPPVTGTDTPSGVGDGTP